MNEYTYSTMREFLMTSPDVTSIDGVISIIDLGMTIRYDRTFGRWALIKSTPVNTLLEEKNNKIEIEYINNFLNSYTVSDMLRSYLKAIRNLSIMTSINSVIITAQQQIYDRKQQPSSNTVRKVPSEIIAPTTINIGNDPVVFNRYAKILTNDGITEVSNKLHSVVASGVLFDFSKLKTHGLYNTESKLISLLKFIFNRLTSEYKIDYTIYYLPLFSCRYTFTVNVKDKIHKWDCENMYILEETDTIYINSHELINAIRKIHDIIETTKSSNRTEPKQTYIRRRCPLTTFTHTLSMLTQRDPSLTPETSYRVCVGKLGKEFNDTYGSFRTPPPMPPFTKNDEDIEKMLPPYVLKMKDKIDVNNLSDHNNRQLRRHNSLNNLLSVLNIPKIYSGDKNSVIIRSVAQYSYNDSKLSHIGDNNSFSIMKTLYRDILTACVSGIDFKYNSQFIKYPDTTMYIEYIYTKVRNNVRNIVNSHYRNAQIDIFCAMLNSIKNQLIEDDNIHLETILYTLTVANGLFAFCKISDEIDKTITALTEKISKNTSTM